MTGFWQEDETPGPGRPRKTDKPFDVLCASKLYNSLREKRKLLHTRNPKVWAKFFRRLREAGHSASKITTVLDWYISHLGEEYVPEAYSASSFKEKFESIERAMDRTGDSVAISTTTITDDAKFVYKQLKSLAWPPKAKKGLKVAIQLTLDNFRAFKRTIRTLAQKVNEEAKTAKGVRFTTLSTFTNYVSRRMGCALDFTENWFRDIQYWLKDKDVNIMKFVFTIKNPKAQALLTKWSVDYTGSDKAWELLKQRLEDESQSS